MRTEIKEFVFLTHFVNKMRFLYMHRMLINLYKKESLYHDLVILYLPLHTRNGSNYSPTALLMKKKINGDTLNVETIQKLDVIMLVN